MKFSDNHLGMVFHKRIFSVWEFNFNNKKEKKSDYLIRKMKLSKNWLEFMFFMISEI